MRASHQTMVHTYEVPVGGSKVSASFIFASVSDLRSSWYGLCGPLWPLHRGGAPPMPNNWVTLRIVVCTRGVQLNVGGWVIGIVLIAIALFVVEVHVSI